MTGATRWQPVATPTSQPYWDGLARGELLIQQCSTCAQHVFYPREACPHCGSRDLPWARASGRARLLSFLISYHPAEGFADNGPNVIAVVELDEGVRMMTNLVEVAADPEAITLDMPLELTVRTRDGVTLPFFRPANVAPQ